MFNLIGICGKAGSGKNALADYIESTDPDKYVLDSFASPLKNGLCSILGLPLKELEEMKDKGEIHPDLGITIRNMLQTLGTEWGRDLINKDIWNILARERILKHPDKVVIMTDVRFDNEANLIHELGGKLIYVSRPTDECRSVGTHSSENSLSEYLIDYIIDNSGSIGELYKKWEELNFILENL